MSAFLVQSIETTRADVRFDPEPEMLICRSLRGSHSLSKQTCAEISMSYKIAFGTPSDIPAILALQESNLPENGGSLSVREAADWFTRASGEKSLVVARRDGKLVGYLLGTSIATKAHVPIIQEMLNTFPTSLDCYLYGPVCVTETERGKGLAGAMFEKLQSHMRRPAITFVRADNGASLRAHRKMGMQDVGPFTNEGVSFVAFAFAAKSV